MLSILTKIHQNTSIKHNKIIQSGHADYVIAAFILNTFRPRFNELRNVKEVERVRGRGAKSQVRFILILFQLHSAHSRWHFIDSTGNSIESNQFDSLHYITIIRLSHNNRYNQCKWIIIFDEERHFYSRAFQPTSLKCLRLLHGKCNTKPKTETDQSHSAGWSK